jgi:hypothetical protein
MDQDGAKRIERRSANRGNPAECISEIRYRCVDTEEELLRYLLGDTPWAGTRTSGSQYKQPAGLGWRTHTEKGNVRGRTTLTRGGNQVGNQPHTGGEARPGKQQNSH